MTDKFLIKLEKMKRTKVTPIGNIEKLEQSFLDALEPFKSMLVPGRNFYKIMISISDGKVVTLYFWTNKSGSIRIRGILFPEIDIDLMISNGISEVLYLEDMKEALEIMSPANFSGLIE